MTFRFGGGGQQVTFRVTFGVTFAEVKDICHDLQVAFFCLLDQR